VKHGIRAVAEDLCTMQLGYRTSLDPAEAYRREVSQFRYTSLDRMINRSMLDDRYPEPMTSLFSSRSS
jgi:hypothetical protein